MVAIILRVDVAEPLPNSWGKADAAFAGLARQAVAEGIAP